MFKKISTRWIKGRETQAWTLCNMNRKKYYNMYIVYRHLFPAHHNWHMKEVILMFFYSRKCSLNLESLLAQNTNETRHQRPFTTSQCNTSLNSNWFLWCRIAQTTQSVITKCKPFINSTDWVTSSQDSMMKFQTNIQRL